MSSHHPAGAGRASVRPFAVARTRWVRAGAGALGAVVLAATLTACGSPSKAPSSGIGDWPSFLPSPSAVHTPRGVAGSPAVVAAGHVVIVDRSPGVMTIELQGPSYPPDTPLGAATVVCTFALAFRGADRELTLDPRDFDILDSHGGLHQLKVADGSTLPERIQPGQTVTAKLVATTPSGENLLRYVPDGEHVLATWDYVAETD